MNFDEAKQKIREKSYMGSAGLHEIRMGDALAVLGDLQKEAQKTLKEHFSKQPSFYELSKDGKRSSKEIDAMWIKLTSEWVTELKEILFPSKSGKCYRCDGTGKIPVGISVSKLVRCPICAGTGKEKAEKLLEVSKK